MNSFQQITINDSCSFEGITLHSGEYSKITLHPSPANTGIKFKRIDSKLPKGQNIIPANFKNIRSSQHLEIFEKKSFNKKDHEKYLKHEKIENLSGLEIDIVYEWELGSMLIFDRTRLHCSSSEIDGKKIGLTTFTKK